MTAARKLTVDDLFANGEDTRDELIHGEIVPLAMAYWPHNNAAGAVYSWLRRRFGRQPGGRWPGGWWIGIEIHVVYATHEVYCHDIVGWRRDRVANVSPSRMAIRPDWVCEVLSPTHEKRDLVDKMGVLHAAQVPHYWVIDREEQILFIYRYDPAGYILVRSVSSNDNLHAEPFDAVELRMAVIFGDEDDEE